MARKETTQPQARQRTQGSAARGESVVASVLEATRAELGRVGYRALRVEDVAERAGVHKTTIYRRWPEKRDLVKDTLQSLFEREIEIPDLGSLRKDLMGFAQNMVQFSSKGDGRSIMRMVAAESADPELRSIVESLRTSKELPAHGIVERAKVRGEVAASLDPSLLVSTLAGAIHHHLLLRSVLPEQYIERLVDLLLHGACAGAKKRMKRARKGDA